MTLTIHQSNKKPQSLTEGNSSLVHSWLSIQLKDSNTIILTRAASPPPDKPFYLVRKRKNEEGFLISRIDSDPTPGDTANNVNRRALLAEDSPTFTITEPRELTYLAVFDHRPTGEELENPPSTQEGVIRFTLEHDPVGENGHGGLR